ncbi:MAG: radical SAM protein [Oscillospiraceae bacterium]|nr:radical SAM protein [Oscillospiraceae bacterium]
MNLNHLSELTEILSLPEERFREDILPLAAAKRQEVLGNRLKISALMGYSNVCKNMCHYCGMRAGNASLPRFRLSPEEVVESCRNAAQTGFRRVFLVSGEDPKYGFGKLLQIVSALSGDGISVSLACGEYTESQYSELKAAGAEEYVVKFEMSNPDSFNRLNPSTSFDKRMEAIAAVKKAGLKLASGNIIDWPGQSLQELAEDILLMKELDICWAPVIPYMPAVGTPLAAEGPRGSLDKLYREITLLRIMMPDIDITATQPGPDLKKGLSDPTANLAAIDAGANKLFFDLLPDPKARTFRVIDDRNISGPSHIYEVARLSGCEADFGPQK